MNKNDHHDCVMMIMMPIIDNARVSITWPPQVVVDNIRASHQRAVNGGMPLGHHRSRAIAFDSYHRLYVQV